MSFRDTLRTVVNYEGIDGLEEGVEFDSHDPTAMDQIEAMEAEVELVQAENDLENDIQGMEDGDDMDDKAETEIAAAEEVVAEADSKAAETGEAPAIPVEDVVASQEALKTLVERFGVPYEGTFASREDLYSNSYAAYTANLEGLKEIGVKIKEGLKKIWEKIVAGFNWIVNQIKKVLPTKLNRIKWLTNKIRDYSTSNVDKGKLKKEQDEFVKNYGEKFAAVAAIVGPNLEKVDTYATGIIDSIKGIETGLLLGKRFGMAKTESEKLKVMTDFGNAMLEFKKKGIYKVLDSSILSSLEKSLEESLSGIKYIEPGIMTLSGKGTTLKAGYAYGVEEDGELRGYAMTITTTVSKITNVTFSKETILKALTLISQRALVIAKASENINKVIKDIGKSVAEAEDKGAFGKFMAARKTEKTLRKSVSLCMSMLTGFDSSVLSYALSYGKATLSAMKNAKVNN